MNLQETSGLLRSLVFRLSRAAAATLPAGKISAFGVGKDKIGSILVINLDRQPQRWRRVLRELGRFRAVDGTPLASITRRLAAVDARDGRAVAAMADIDSLYRMGDQLFVQPDPRLEECFGVDEQIRMTRQEVAVAKSHVEAWKAIANGTDHYALVLEDDVWFKRGAAATIDRGWREALRRYQAKGGPHLLYLSYKDAVGIAGRTDIGDALFRPLRGLWFLSGYVLSREGAGALLRAMPVVGPVDLWVNYRFAELNVLALSSPAIMQREDSGSDNSYSILPYLARAGIVDAGSSPMRPDSKPSGLVLAWTAGGEREGLAMALSMLGLRVRAFDGSEELISNAGLAELGEIFDALVDAPLASEALAATIARKDVKFFLEVGASVRVRFVPAQLPPDRTTVLLCDNSIDSKSWKPLCDLLDLPEPVQAFPIGAPPCWRIFRDDRPNTIRHPADFVGVDSFPLDDSPWILPANCKWRPQPIANRPPLLSKAAVDTTVNVTEPILSVLVETFPGNLASFAKDALIKDGKDTRLIISKNANGSRLYRSGAFATVGSYCHGRFQAEIKAARGYGLVTGFFLHRDSPRQEIDIEFPGDDPQRMLVNVYFNPGDDEAAMSFGYRGSPYRIDLGFDATSDFHLYAIDWRPGYITWSVDGRTVHERVGWDPTPLPHLPMRLHGNLWAPRSEEIAGRINDDALPATASFNDVSIQA